MSRIPPSRYFVNDQGDKWRFDGVTLESFSGTRWVVSIFNDPEDLRTTLNHIVEVEHLP